MMNPPNYKYFQQHFLSQLKILISTFKISNIFNNIQMKSKSIIKRSTENPIKKAKIQLYLPSLLIKIKFIIRY